MKCSIEVLTIVANSDLNTLKLYQVKVIVIGTACILYTLEKCNVKETSGSAVRYRLASKITIKVTCRFALCTVN